MHALFIKPDKSITISEPPIFGESAAREALCCTQL